MALEEKQNETVGIKGRWQEHTASSTGVDSASSVPSWAKDDPPKIVSSLAKKWQPEKPPENRDSQSAKETEANKFGLKKVKDTSLKIQPISEKAVSSNNTVGRVWKSSTGPTGTPRAKPTNQEPEKLTYSNAGLKKVSSEPPRPTGASSEPSSATSEKQQTQPAAYPKIGLKKVSSEQMDRPTRQSASEKEVPAYKMGLKKIDKPKTQNEQGPLSAPTEKKEPAYKRNELKKVATDAPTPTKAIEPPVVEKEVSAYKMQLKKVDAETKQEARSAASTEKEEPAYKMELNHVSPNKTQRAQEPLIVEKEVSAYKMPLKKVDAETNQEARAVTPTENEEPAFKMDLKKINAPTKPNVKEPLAADKEVSAYKIELKKVDDESTQSKQGPLRVPAKEPQYKTELKKVSTETPPPRATEPLPAETGVPAYKMPLKKVDAEAKEDARAVAASEKEEPAYKMELNHVSPNKTQRAQEPLIVEKEVSAYKMPLKKVDTETNQEARAVAPTENEEPAFKMELKKINAPTKPNVKEPLATDKEVSVYKIGLKKVDDESTQSKQGPLRVPAKEPPYKTELKKVSAEAPPPNTVDPSAVEIEVSAYKMSLKKIDAATKQDVQTDAFTQKEVPAYKMELNHVRPNKISPAQEPLTAAQEVPAYKLPLKKVGAETTESQRKHDLNKKWEASTPASDYHQTSRMNRKAPKDAETSPVIPASGTRRQSLAEKELEEVRALGLTKNLTTKEISTDASSSKLSAFGRKGDDTEATVATRVSAETELEDIRALGLTKASFSKSVVKERSSNDAEKSARPQMINDQTRNLVARAQRPSLADKELQELRALGLTTAISKRSIAFDDDNKRNHVKDLDNHNKQSSIAEKELDEVRALGLTKAISKKSVTKDGSMSSDWGHKSDGAVLGRERAIIESQASSARVFSSGTVENKATMGPSKRKSTAEEELAELRVLGLTQAISKSAIRDDFIARDLGRKSDGVVLGREIAIVQSQASSARVFSSESVENKTLAERSKRKSSAEEELAELRALGLTKAISSKKMADGATSDWGHKSDGSVLRREMTKVGSQSKSARAFPSGTIENKAAIVRSNISPAEKELEGLRALGLTKAMSKKSFKDDGLAEDSNRSQGPAWGHKSEGTVFRREIPMGEPQSKSQKSLTRVFSNDSEEIMVYEDGSYEEEVMGDTVGEIGTTDLEPEVQMEILGLSPNAAGESTMQQQTANVRFLSHIGSAKNGDAPPNATSDTFFDPNLNETASPSGSKGNSKKKKDRSPEHSDDSTAAKAALRKQRKENKESFKGVKRFLFGKQKK